MAHVTDQAAFPGIALQAGMMLKLEAIDPATGAAITGVTCTSWMIYGEELLRFRPSVTAAPVPILLPMGD